MTKYNLGCGTSKKEGYVNIDKYEIFNPDKVMDLEKFPWDIEDNSASKIVLHHVLEHIGETTECFLNVMKEIYRISKPFAKIYITVPHPYSYDFIVDPTHVRRITEHTLQMFSKKSCDELGKNNPTTRLAYICDVNFDVTNIKYHVNDEVCNYLVSKNLISENFKEELANDFHQKIFLNIINSMYVELTAIKYT